MTWAAGLVLLTACSAPPVVEDGSRADPVLQAQEERPDDVLRWNFDGEDPLSGLSVGSGGRPVVARVESRNEGAVTAERPGADGAGGAARFPPVCDGDECPHATLVGPDDARLDPGQRDFQFGVTVLVQPTDLSSSHGSNLVQKGDSSHAQWKLQIDGGGSGRPSCVVRSAGGGTPVTVRATVGVADGTWHRIACRRTSTSLAVLVDDVIVASEPLPAGYSIEPAGEPLTLGAKGPGLNNDQFHGVLDDVYLAYAP
jgi:hypothetical protein